MSTAQTEEPKLVEHTVQTTLGTVAVSEAGEGPVLVMLHGGGPGASAVANYDQNLAALTPHFRVVLPDQPGFGGSYRPTEADLDARSITEITVDALLQTLDALGIDRLHLLGNSLGGAAAIATALAAPERVEKLVLMAPGAAGCRSGRPRPRGRRRCSGTTTARARR